MVWVDGVELALCVLSFIVHQSARLLANPRPVCVGITDVKLINHLGRRLSWMMSKQAFWKRINNAHWGR